MPSADSPSGNGQDRPPALPDAEATARAEEHRFLLKLAVWFLLCAILGASLLVFSIWVDWV